MAPRILTVVGLGQDQSQWEERVPDHQKALLLEPFCRIFRSAAGDLLVLLVGGEIE